MKGSFESFRKAHEEGIRGKILIYSITEWIDSLGINISLFKVEKALRAMGESRMEDPGMCLEALGHMIINGRETLEQALESKRSTFEIEEIANEISKECKRKGIQVSSYFLREELIMAIKEEKISRKERSAEILRKALKRRLGALGKIF